MGALATASELARAIRAREASVLEIVDAHLARIAREDPALNAIVTLDEERARAKARAADEALARGGAIGPLHGVPFTLKDSHATAGMRTTAGHPPLAEHVPAEDGAVAARLQAAGAILLGKTNVPPLLMSAQTNNPIFGRSNNPWDLARTTGGSSGGAAAAVAAGLAAFDVGSDMSGSVRIPASYCGIYGLKPTTHRIPVTGHIPPLPGMVRFDRMLATAGPMARSVEDLELVMSVLVGPDGRDTEVPPVPWRPADRRAPATLRIAFLSSFPGVPTSRETKAVVSRVATTLAQAGARVEERMPGFAVDELNEAWRAAFGIFGPVVAELMGAGLPTPPPEAPRASLVEWVRVMAARDVLIEKLERLLGEVDAFLCPATIAEAFPHGPPRTPIPVDGASVESRFVDHYLYPFNFTGHPAVVLPAGMSEGGLPLGVQLVGKRWDDERLLAVASAVVSTIGGFRPPPARG